MAQDGMRAQVPLPTLLQRHHLRVTYPATSTLLRLWSTQAQPTVRCFRQLTSTRTPVRDDDDGSNIFVRFRSVVLAMQNQL